MNVSLRTLLVGAAVVALFLQLTTFHQLESNTFLRIVQKERRDYDLNHGVPQQEHVQQQQEEEEQQQQEEQQQLEQEQQEQELALALPNEEHQRTVQSNSKDNETNLNDDVPNEILPQRRKKKNSSCEDQEDDHDNEDEDGNDDDWWNRERFENIHEEDDPRLSLRHVLDSMTLHHPYDWWWWRQFPTHTNNNHDNNNNNNNNKSRDDNDNDVDTTTTNNNNNNNETTITNATHNHDTEISSSSKSKSAFHQTLCHEHSRFLNPQRRHVPNHDAVLDDYDWHMRLLYLGIYLHQYLPAKHEMQQRLACQEQQQQQQQQQDTTTKNASSNILLHHRDDDRHFDFQCRHRHHNNNNNSTTTTTTTTKFIVAPMPNAGAGSTFRNGAVTALLAGLATNRVVVFVSNLTFGSDSMQYPWLLASEDDCPRADYQCYLLPVTPCVLTIDEIKMADQRTERLYQQLLQRSNRTDINMMEVFLTDEFDKYGIDGGGYALFEKERILVVDAVAMPIQPHVAIERRIRKRIYDLILQQQQQQQQQVMQEEQPTTTATTGTTNRQAPQQQQQQYWIPPRHVLDEILLRPYHEYNAMMARNRSFLHNHNHHNYYNPFGRKFDQATSTLHHAALLFMLRPNQQFRQLMQDDVRLAIPQDFDPEWSFGLPIRASDKCDLESTCLTFDQYMELTKQQYHKYWTDPVGTNSSISSTTTTTKRIASIVLTSEAASIMSRRHKYITTTAAATATTTNNTITNTTSFSTAAAGEFPFRFVVNERDVTQGHGQPVFFNESEQGPTGVMLSTMVALQLQLYSKYTVVNCCSSFHRMILDLLRSGCGAVARPEFRCLQETDDPQFHLCCFWDGGDPRCRKALTEFRNIYKTKKEEYA